MGNLNAQYVACIKNVKFGKCVACMLLIMDIVINLISKKYYAVIIDVVILVDMFLALPVKEEL